MITLHPSDVVSSSAPATLFGWQPPGNDGSQPLGFFTELYELERQVLDASGTIVSAWTAVDVDTAGVADHSGLYLAPYSVPATTSYGTWTVQWRFRVVDASSDQLTAVTYFRVIATAQPIVDGYVQVQDMLDEGVPSALYTPARIARAITVASQLFEEWTGRQFGPHLLMFDVDGRGGAILQLGHEIIGLTGVALTLTAFTTSDLEIESGDLCVYNRHIRSELLNPDDRQDPRVEFLRWNRWGYERRGGIGEADLLSNYLGFAESQQNIRLSGVFGYTDPDGTPFGKVPELVREAVMRIAMRKLAPLWAATGGGSSSGVAGPIVSEKTMDQSVTFANLAATGNTAFAGVYTGDPEIDQIIMTYRRPILIRSA